MKVYSLIPAYNEEKNIFEVVSKLKKNGIQSIVIDDCSTDKTEQRARKAGALVFRHKQNMGKGEALKTGFSILRSHPDVDHVILIDADMQYSPEEAIRLLNPLKTGEANFVTGYRNWRGVPFRHRLGNWVWRTTFNLLFGTRLRDTNCGFMALTKEAINSMERVGGGYIIENMILSDAIKNGLRIKQVPVTVKYAEKRRFLNGSRIVGGVLIFIIKEGIKYRLGRK